MFELDEKLHMNSSPLVSVIIPTYNRQTSLRPAIESVLAQTVENFEILICDDGSTDSSQSMVQGFNDTRVRWLSDKNTGGPAAPRNRGIKAARGEWLAFLDSDDLWTSTKLEEQIRAAKENGVRMVCTNASVMKDGVMSPSLFFQNSSDRILTFGKMLRANYVVCSSMMIHRSIPEQVGNFPESSKFKAIEDYALWLSGSMISSIYYLSKPLTIYRDEPQASIRSEAKDSEFVKKNRILREVIRRTKLMPNNRVYFLSRATFSYVLKNLVHPAKAFTG